MLALFIALPLAGIFLAWFYLFRNPTNIPVSPGSRPIIGHMHHFFVTAETLYKFEQNYIELTDPKHGDVSHLKFFFKSNFSLNTVDLAEPLLKSNVNINKSFQYDTLSDWLKNSVIISPGEEWQKRRHLLTPAFHFHILDDFQQTMKTHGVDMVEKIKTGRPIVDVITDVTFNSLCETSFNHKFKSAAESDEFRDLMRLLMISIFERDFSLSGKFGWWYYRTEAGRNEVKYNTELNKLIMKLVDARREELRKGTTKLHNGKRGFLDTLVYEEARQRELTEEDIVGECNTILLAGHSTTTSTLSFCLYYLARHREVQERLYQELAAHLAGGDFSQLDPASLPYLGCVVKETLRLQPPAGQIGRVLTTPLQTGPYFLPAGSNLDISIWWLHRDPAHWDDPEVFDPERFTPENSRTRHPYAFVPFSAGPRNCLGQRFAMLEAKILLAAVVYHFKMSTEQELGRELRRDIHVVSVVPGPHFDVRFEERI